MSIYKTLSVGELIEALKQFPSDMAVFIEHDMGGGPVLSPEIDHWDDEDEDAVCLRYLWTRPSEYDDKIWIDHRGHKQVVKSYHMDGEQ